MATRLPQHRHAGTCLSEAEISELIRLSRSERIFRDADAARLCKRLALLEQRGYVQIDGRIASITDAGLAALLAR